MLNDAMNEVVLVKGWKKGANWSFPRGKINKDERDLDCAVREVYEETGFDIQGAGLVGSEEDMKSIEVTMREQHMLMYVFRGVPTDTHFEPRTRKEISKIEWWKLSDLPTLKKNKNHQDGRSEELVHNANKFYMVAPFLNQLKKWISLQRKNDAIKASRTDTVLPTVAQEEINLEGNGLRQNGVSKPPVENDMSRLLANLRQSSGRVPTVNDFPEVSDPIVTAKDASTQLKNLLRVPAAGPRQGLDQPISPIDDRKSEALLSLLRNNKSSGQSRSGLHTSLPQTPFDQILEPPQIPHSPKHHAPQPVHISTLPPPPTFPFQPAHAKKDSRMPLSTMQYPEVSGRRVQQPTISPNQLPHSYHVSFPAHQTVAPYAMEHPVTQPNHQPVAPYHRTGDPQFARPSNFPESHAPFIPPASRLPPPKMTSHSSALLNIFKSGQSASLIPNKGPGEAQSIPQPQIDTRATKTNNLPRQLNAGTDSNHTPRIEGPGTGLMQQESVAQLSAGLGRPRSQHQDALLDIFRKSSVSGTEMNKSQNSTLLPSREPVELSAQPSPGHSREPSKADEVSTRRPSTNLQSGRVTIQKRPVTRGTLDTAPVSATISGPLNIPQFDKVSKKSRNTPNANGKLEKDAGLNIQKPAPVTILPRPIMPTSTLETATIAPNSPKGVLQRQHPQATSAQSKPAKVRQEASKPFQPQILRRPGPAQQSPKELAARSPAQESPRTQPDLSVDRKSSQAQEHRQALLNLFAVPGSQNSPTTPGHTANVSPMSEKPTRPGSVVPPPLTLSTSKLGNVSSLVGDGGLKTNSGKTTPKTTPVNRSFLLGYLEGVARGEGS